MPQGQPSVVPDDGLTTRQRRNRPLIAVHTGDGKGKSTAAFGMAMRAWNQGFDIGVFQFVKSAKWRVGEENALTALGRLHEQTGEGGRRVIIQAERSAPGVVGVDHQRQRHDAGGVGDGDLWLGGQQGGEHACHHQAREQQQRATCAAAQLTTRT